MIIRDNTQNICGMNEIFLYNFLRCLTMLEKTLERLARQNYYDRSQYPEIFIETENAVNTARAWVETHRQFSGFPVFQNMLITFIIGITDQVGALIEAVRPAQGKKPVKKTLRTRQREILCSSIESMIGKLLQLPDKLQNFESEITDEIEEALIKSFKKHCVKKHERRRRESLSKRGEKTYIFPWSDPDEYQNIVTDTKRFRREVVDKLKDHLHATGHCTKPKISMK